MVEGEQDEKQTQCLFLPGKTLGRNVRSLGLHYRLLCLTRFWERQMKNGPELSCVLLGNQANGRHLEIR